MSAQQNLKVAILQLTSTDEVESNRAQILGLLASLKNPADVDLICLPENSLYLRVKEGEAIHGFELSDPVFGALQIEAERLQAHLHLGSVAIRQGAKLVNASVLLAPGVNPSVSYQKIHLFDIELVGHPPVRESDVFAAGHLPQVLSLKGWELGQSICYDVRFAELYSKYAVLGVSALLVPSSFLVPTGLVHWHVLLRARAIESQSYVIAAAQAGEHKSQRTASTRKTFGHSLIIDPWGQVLAEGCADRPEVILAELSLERVQFVRRQIPMHNHRRLLNPS